MSKSDEPTIDAGTAGLWGWITYYPYDAFIRTCWRSSVLADVFNTDLRGRPRTVERKKPSSVPTDPEK